MKVWIVTFIEDVSEASRVFSTKEKAWNFLERNFKRIYPDYENETDYINLKKSYEECCQNNGYFFMNDYIVVVEAAIDEED